MKLFQNELYCYNEGNRVVFTALFHIQRGFCCGNGCKHCPYEPKSIKYNTKMDIKILEQIKQQVKDLEDNNLISNEDKKVEAIKIFEQLNQMLGEYISNEEDK
jgi:biotin synthase-like enzyme